MMFYISFSLPDEQMSTICAIIMAVVGIVVLHHNCQPYNTIRKALMGIVVVVILICVLFLKQLFTLSDLSGSSMLVLGVFAVMAYPLMTSLYKYTAVLDRHLEERDEVRKAERYRGIQKTKRIPARRVGKK